MTRAPYNHGMTFILRVSVDATGRVNGIVERARTGEKERFQGLEALGRLIARLVEDAGPEVEEITS